MVTVRVIVGTLHPFFVTYFFLTDFLIVNTCGYGRNAMWSWLRKDQPKTSHHGREEKQKHNQAYPQSLVPKCIQKAKKVSLLKKMKSVDWVVIKIKRLQDVRRQAKKCAWRMLRRFRYIVSIIFVRWRKRHHIRGLHILACWRIHVTFMNVSSYCSL